MNSTMTRIFTILPKEKEIKPETDTNLTQKVKETISCESNSIFKKVSK